MAALSDCALSTLFVLYSFDDASFYSEEYVNILLYVHRSEVAYQGRGQGGRGRKNEGSIARTHRGGRGPPPEQQKC